MPTAYNLHTTSYSAKEANRGNLVGPASDNVIYLHRVDGAVVELSSAGTFTLEPAARVPVDTEILVLAQAAVTVNGITLADGDWQKLRVVKDASGNHEWVAYAGVGSLGSVVAAVVALGTVDINTGDAATDTALIALLNGLKAAGLVTGTFS